jgi:hypothetical protein
MKAIIPDKAAPRVVFRSGELDLKCPFAQWAKGALDIDAG